MQMSERNKLLIILQRELAVTIDKNIKDIEGSAHITFTAEEIKGALTAVILASENPQFMVE